ncbi:MAG: hypothetical protein LBR89_04400 [Holosporales bacterium]|jgi:hypothetical protein|nr:hypothetical protein [Holosporales bacterium]
MKNKICLLASILATPTFAATDCDHFDVNTPLVGPERVHYMMSEIKKAFNGVHYVHDDVKTEDGSNTLFIVQVKNGDEFIAQLFCSMIDATHGITYDDNQGQKTQLKLTFEDDRIIQVEAFDGTDYIVQEESSLLKEVLITPYRLPLVTALGRPEAMYYSMDENGITMHVRPFMAELKDIQSRIAGVAGQCTGISQSMAENHGEMTTKFDTLAAELPVLVDNKVQETLLQQHNSLLDSTMKAISDEEKYLTSVVMNALEKSKEHTHFTVAKQVSDSQNALLQALTASTTSLTNTVNTALAQIQDAITQLGLTMQERNKNIVSEQLRWTHALIEKSKTEMLTALQDITGVRYVKGVVKYGSLAERVTREIHKSYTKIGVVDDLATSLDTVRSAFQAFGGVPLFYIGNVESMLFGHSYGIERQVVTSLEDYVRDFVLLTDNDHFLDLQGTFNEIAQQIHAISEFVQYADHSLIMRMLPMFLALFGQNIPPDDTFSHSILNYCKNAHFSLEDYGLYPWIKDLHEVLSELPNAARSPKRLGRSALYKVGADARVKVERLLRSVVLSTGEGGVPTEVYAIPQHSFHGLLTYPDILKEYIEIIQNIYTHMPYVRLERTISSLISDVKKVHGSSVRREIALTEMVQMKAKSDFNAPPKPSGRKTPRGPLGSSGFEWSDDVLQPFRPTRSHDSQGGHPRRPRRDSDASASGQQDADATNGQEEPPMQEEPPAEPTPEPTEPAPEPTEPAPEPTEPPTEPTAPPTEPAPEPTEPPSEPTPE